jgi:Major Facilitator Superfamily
MHGLYLLWWVQEKHVPVAVVAALLAAGDLAITALEIPTGWLADRFGHRVSLIAGSLTQAAAMVFCWLGEGVVGLLSAILLVALGDTLRSGADQALLYRSCLALEREPDFQRIESRSRSLQLVALVAFILTGGAIVERWAFAAGWIVETAVSVVGVVIALAMVEPPPGVDAGAGGAAASLEDARSSRLSSLNLDVFLTLIAPAALLGATAGAMAFVAQTSGESDPGRMTMLVAVITLAEAMGAAVAAHLTPSVRNQLVLVGLGAVVAVAGLALRAWFVPAVIALSWLQGMVEPLRAAAIQRVAADHVRARAASVASACDKAAATIALVVAGVLPRRR